MRSVLLLSLLVVGGCKTAPAPAPVPPTPEEELAALLKSIPVECVAPATGSPVECPPAVEATLGNACVVERFDARSGRSTDRLVFVDGLLVREELTLSANAGAVTAFRYDGARRLREQTRCFSASAGASDWSPTWRPALAEVIEAPVDQRAHTVLTYAGDAGVPATADVTSTTGDAGFQLRLCYAYADGHRARRVQTFRDRTATLQTEVRTYAWAKERLQSIDVRRVGLKGTAVASRSSFRVAFTWDDAARLSAYTRGDDTTRFTWDARGRLVSAFNGTASFAWDDRDRLIEMKVGDASLDGHFTWDEGGRIASAQFANGEGYRVVYGTACARDLRAESVTPSIDPFLFYEGKDAL